jgi:hypothetical protein
MSTATLVASTNIWATTYRLDCDHGDGALVERNLEAKDHSKLQREILLCSQPPLSTSKSSLPTSSGPL